MSRRPQRTVLVVAYFFPPLGGAGVQRTLKFVKYLPAYDYGPVVLSTAARDHPAQDPTLVSDVPPGTALVRARDPSPLRRARVGFDFLGLSLLRELAGWPDESAAWIPAALVGALRMIRRHRPQVIFSSGPPFSAHVVAWLASRQCRLPWVADFRDEFTANPHAEGRVGRVQRLSATLERRAVGDATRVVTVADYFQIEGAPSQDPRRTTIVNGVDPEDLIGPDGGPDPARFRLSFVGTLYGDRDLGPVAAALRRLSARGVLDPACCELRLVGSMWLRQPPDAGAVPVVQTGYVDHAAAVAEMRGASVLVLYAPQSSPAPSGKIYEYLACGRPILCVARADNLAHQLVRDWDAGCAAEPGDDAGVELAIAQLYAQWRQDPLRALRGPRAKVLDRYSRRRLAGDLAAVLDDAIGDGRRPASET